MRPTDPRLLAQLAPARRQLTGVLTAGLVTSVLVIAQAWTVTSLVVAVVGGRPVLGPAVAVVVVLGLRGLVGWASDGLAARAAAVVGTSLRRRLMTAVTADGRQVDDSSGGVATLVTRGVNSAEPYLTRYLPALVLACVLPPLTVAAIATQDLLSAFIVLATLPLVPVFGILVGLSTRDRAEKQWRAMTALSGHFLDVVRGLPTLIAHRRARAQSDRIAEVTDSYRRNSLSTLKVAFASSAVLELVATLSVALVAVTVGVRLAAGGLDLRTALVVLLLAPEAYWPLRRVGAEFHAAAEGVATFEAADHLLSASAPASDPVDRLVRAPGPGAPITVDHLTVLHPGRTVPALDDFSATLLGRGVSIVTGPSGCGKSTLLAALAGALPTTPGSLASEGTEIGGPAWTSQVAWLPQRPLFVAGSIAANLRLAAPDADDDQLWQALRRVALEERVRDLPRGIDAPLGEDGTTLSSGERARLALARVVLAQRPWVLLDEPTAHLDDLTEMVIADTVVELGRDAAVVVVAHRPSLIALADHLVEVPAPAAPAGAAPATAARPTLEFPGDAAARPSVRVIDPSSESPAPDSIWGLRFATVVGALASVSGVALTATAGWLIVQASTQPPVLTLLVAVVAVRAFGIARPVLRYAERLQSHDAALRLLARRRVEGYNAVVPLTPARLGRRRGDVLSSIVDDTDSVVDRELRVRMPLRGYAIVAVLASVLCTALLPAAGAAVTGFALGAGVLAYVLPRLGASRAEHHLVDRRAELSSYVVETVQIADELRTWQATAGACDRVAELSDRLGDAASSSARWLGAARGLVLAVTGAAVVLVAYLTQGALDAGQVSGPIAALLILVPLALSDVVLPLTDAGALSVRTQAAAARMHALEHATPAVRDTVALADSPLHHDFDVSGVRARLTPAAALTPPVSLHLGEGERVAVVGASGCGKSTLAALMLRFVDPAEGRIELGGVSTRSLTLDDVRRRTGLVDDDPHVFATTVVENVRLARTEASDADVEAVLRQARLGPWLDALPDGLHTWLGDGHAQLSGGERARLGIARSFLADQPILVLDEPAAHLDHATATELAHELLTGPRERSVLWITHGDVGLDLVDRVVDLDLCFADAEGPAGGSAGGSAGGHKVPRDEASGPWPTGRLQDRLEP
ncbi:thiol reductant ABC exporter subunit CydD [soil metagenome]